MSYTSLTFDRFPPLFLFLGSLTSLSALAFISFTIPPLHSLSLFSVLCSSVLCSRTHTGLTYQALSLCPPFAPYPPPIFFLFFLSSLELTAKREEVLAKLKDLQEKSEPLRELFLLPEVQEMAASVDGTQLREYLESNHGFKVESLDTLYDYAHMLYDIGMYDDAGQMLYQFSALVPDTSERAFSALWGRFACGILGQKWDDAVKDLSRLKEFIDAEGNNPTAALRQLQQRTWLIHWSLFVFFRFPNTNPETGLDALIELFLYDAPYANTIQTVCPHILRQVARVCALLCALVRSCARALACALAGVVCVTFLRFCACVCVCACAGSLCLFFICVHARARKLCLCTHSVNCWVFRC